MIGVAYDTTENRIFTINTLLKVKKIPMRYLTRPHRDYCDWGLSHVKSFSLLLPAFGETVYEFGKC